MEGRGVVMMVSATSGIWLIIVVRTVSNLITVVWTVPPVEFELEEPLVQSDKGLASQP